MGGLGPGLSYCFTDTDSESDAYYYFMAKSGFSCVGGLIIVCPYH